MRGKTQPTVRKELERAARLLQPKNPSCPAERGLGNLEAEILLAHVLKKSRAWIQAHDEKPLSAPQTKRFRDLVSRRKRHEPIAYILGEKEFYGLPIRVTPAVLIPRPSSETLVELTRKVATKRAPLVLDVGTGSGAIALAVAASLPRARVIGTDVSASALRLAKTNAKRLRIKNISFRQADLLDKPLLSALRKNTLPLIIVANLPYLPTADKKTLEPDVLRFEPRSALFGGKDGNDVIIRLLDQLRDSKLRFRAAFLEFDPPQTRALKTLAKQYFPGADVSVHKDLENTNRVLAITRP